MPTCPDTTLAITDRQGIEIDYCPQCRDVWLDRGKLDKLMERAAAQAPSAIAAVSRPDFADSNHHGAQRHPAGRKKSWTSSIDGSATRAPGHPVPDNRCGFHTEPCHGKAGVPSQTPTSRAKMPPMYIENSRPAENLSTRWRRSSRRHGQAARTAACRP
ncbi:MAG: zf-TFIIB domain-containing protein [Burkholderiales bacterium]